MLQQLLAIFSRVVRPEPVQQAIQKYIRPQDMTLIVVGDRNKVESQLTDHKPAGKLPGSK